MPPDGGVPLTKPRRDCFADIKRYHPRAAYTATASLGWAIIVESALLNKRLTEDVDKVASEKGCLCGPVAQLKFYLPKPMHIHLLGRGVGLLEGLWRPISPIREPLEGCLCNGVLNGP